MAAEVGVRWFHVRKWEAIFWRVEALLFAGSPLMVLQLVLLNQRFTAWLLAFGCAFILRFLRGVTLAVAVLPDAILVRRALSLRDDVIPIATIGSAVFRSDWQGEGIVIYRRNRMLAPLLLVHGWGMHYPRAEWADLAASLRELLLPLGRWKERPWWWPWFPL